MVKLVIVEHQGALNRHLRAAVQRNAAILELIRAFDNNLLP